MEPLNPWFGKAAIVGIVTAIIVIRAPFGRQSRKIPIAANHRGPRETAVLALAWLGSMILPLLWVCSPLFAIAEYPLNPAVFAAGVVVAASGLWLFRQSLSSLGKIGRFRWICGRTSAGDIGPLPVCAAPDVHLNLFVRPWSGLGCAELDCRPREPGGVFCVVCRQGWIGRTNDGADKFGDQYRNYLAKTKRLIPGIW